MIRDAVHITGRGIILICDNENFHVGDTITLEVSGIERLETNPKVVGLVVKPTFSK